jgi:hypothetical protein
LGCLIPRQGTWLPINAVRAPTLIAKTFFEPQPASDEAFEDFEAAEEIDAGPLRRPPHAAATR